MFPEFAAEFVDTEEVATVQKTFGVVSMFSGCGGMDLGFKGGFDFLGQEYKRTRFDILWANDINNHACGTYRENISNHIRSGSVWDHLDSLPQPDEVDVLIGGFPCQDISVNGKGRGVDGPKSGLYRAVVKAIDILQPKIFVAENVKGLLMKQNASSLERVLHDFKNLGYQITYKLLNSADFGVPQTRERVFIVGTKGTTRAFHMPEPKLDKGAWITARQAISDLEARDEDVFFSHIWSRCKSSPEQGNRRLVAQRPGYTVRAECHGNIHWHYDLDRRMSMREAARVQSFPDSFLFKSKLRETERQIGNAVPPVLAWHMAHAVENYLHAKTS